MLTSFLGQINLKNSRRIIRADSVFAHSEFIKFLFVKGFGFVVPTKSSLIFTSIYLKSRIGKALL